MSLQGQAPTGNGFYYGEYFGNLEIWKFEEFGNPLSPTNKTEQRQVSKQVTENTDTYWTKLQGLNSRDAFVKRENVPDHHLDQNADDGTVDLHGKRPAREDLHHRTPLMHYFRRPTTVSIPLQTQSTFRIFEMFKKGIEAFAKPPHLPGGTPTRLSILGP